MTHLTLALLIHQGIVSAAAAPEVANEPVSSPGNSWILGKNQVLCGDATILSDVEKLMNGNPLAISTRR